MWPKIKLFFHNHWNGTTKPQRFFLLSLILTLAIIPAIASADVATFVIEIATNLVSIIVNFLGKLVAVILHCLVYVAQYNNFINEGVVREGWKVVRDICNMFFVLGLLIIAFGTVLRLQNYSGKNSLKNLIVGAVMVNFSKTICGLIIDFAQVVMLTFVNGFKDVGAGNLTQMLGLTTLFNVVASDKNANAMDSLGVFTSYLLALVYLVIALVAILSMTIMLIQRAVMIWIYVVLSPFPYLLSALPKTGSLGSKGNQWWTEFTGLVVVGPLLAFFLWLSFFTASGTNLSSSNNKGSQLILGEGTGGLNTTEGTVIDVNAGVTESGTAQSIIKFIVSIGLLFGGMKVAQQSSSLVGGTIGAGMQRLQKLQKGATKKLTSGAKTVATNTGKLVSRNALKGGGAIISGLSKNSSSTAGKTFQKIGTAASTWGNELTDARKKEKVKARLKTLEKLGLGVGDETMKTFKDVADDEGFKKAANVGTAIKGAAIGTGVGMITANPLAGIAAGLAFGGAKGVITATDLNKKTGSTIKQFINGTDAPIYEKAYQDYDKNVAAANNQLIVDQNKAKADYEAAKTAAANNYQKNQKKTDYTKELKEAKDKYDFDKKEAKRNYHINHQDAKNNLQAEFIKAQDKTSNQANANEFTSGNINTKQDGFDQIKSDYEGNRKNILKRTDTYQEKTKDLDELEKNYKQQLETLYQNPQFKVKQTPSRVVGYFGGAKALNNLGDNLEKYHPLQLTSDAAQSFLKDQKDAKNAVTDYSKGATLTTSDFSNGRKATKFQENFFSELSGSSHEALLARQNIEQQINSLTNSDGDQKKVQAIMTFLARQEKKGGSTALFSGMISALNTKNNGGKDYEQNLADVRLRQVGDAAIKGDGSKSLKINSFAAGKHNANIIGVDFNKLASLKDSVAHPDLTAGANIAPEKMAAVSQELTGLIDSELAELGQANQSLINQPLAVLEQKISQLRANRSSAFKSGDQAAITQAQNSTVELEQLSRARDLRQAKEKLANPSALNNLSLKNTGISLGSAKESQTTNIHEALHGFGIDNEELTENIAKAMAQGSYQIDDAAQVAQNIKQTISQKKITPEQITSTDINSAISGIKPATSVEQVIAKENGTTIVNNITNNNVVNNITNKNKIVEPKDNPISRAPENRSRQNNLQKNNEKLDSIKKDTLERRAFEDRRYFMDKKDNKRNNDKIKKFIQDFDHKQ